MGNPNCVPLGNKSQGFFKTKGMPVTHCLQIILIVGGRKLTSVKRLTAKRISKGKSITIAHCSTWSGESSEYFRSAQFRSSRFQWMRMRVRPTSSMTPWLNFKLLDVSHCILFQLSENLTMDLVTSMICSPEGSLLEMTVNQGNAGTFC